MKMIIDGVDFHDLEVQKYWSFPKSYKKDPKEETRSMIFSGDYIGSRKMDGAFYKFVKDMDGNMELLGRSKSVSGDYLNKIDWVPHLMPFFNEVPNGTCLIGELYFPDNEGSNKVTTIMGCLVDKAIARQEKGSKLHYYVFDILAEDGHSYLNMNIEKRIKELGDLKCWISLNAETQEEQYFPEIDWAKYYKGAELWEELQTILAHGGEGIVMTKMGTCYQPGKRPARQTLKVKKELSDTVDVFFTGRATPATIEYKGKEVESWQYWQNTITEEKFLDNGQNTYKKYVEGDTIIPITKGHYYGWAGSLEVGVLKDGKVTPVGFLSGLPDEVKANVKSYAMKPFEMTAMQITEDGAFRHGKFLNWRSDLAVEDCTWEKIFK